MITIPTGTIVTACCSWGCCGSACRHLTHHQCISSTTSATHREDSILANISDPAVEQGRVTQGALSGSCFWVLDKLSCSMQYISVLLSSCVGLCWCLYCICCPICLVVGRWSGYVSRTDVAGQFGCRDWWSCGRFRCTSVAFGRVGTCGSTAWLCP